MPLKIAKRQIDHNPVVILLLTIYRDSAFEQLNNTSLHLFPSLEIQVYCTWRANWEVFLHIHLCSHQQSIINSSKPKKSSLWLYQG